MHHRSSSHESIFQCGMAHRKGSWLETSVATTSQPRSLAKLWANPHKARNICWACGPSPPSPYKKRNPKGSKKLGTDGKRSQGKTRSRTRVVLASVFFTRDTPFTSSVNTSLQFHTLRMAQEGGGSNKNRAEPDHVSGWYEPTRGTARKVPRLSLLPSTESTSRGKNSVVASLLR